MSSENSWKQHPHQDEPLREESTTKEGEKTIPFLRRLIDMLQENEEVISFYPGVQKKNGQSTAGRIVVHDRSRVESEILPRYFNHASFASLRRQLNYFCFSRIGKGKQRGATYCNQQVIELHDILRLKRRVTGSTTQSPDYSEKKKEENISQPIQQSTLKFDSSVHSSPHLKSYPTEGLLVRKKFHNSRINKKRRRILNSIVPVVHLSNRGFMEDIKCDSKERTNIDYNTGTVYPQRGARNRNIGRRSLDAKLNQIRPFSPNLNRSPNENGETLKKKKIMTSLPGMNTKFLPNLSLSDISEKPIKLSRNKEADVLDGCNALLSLGCQV